MIVTKDFPNRHFNNKEELLNALRENKKNLKAQKMLQLKEADAFNYSVILANNKQETNKNEANSQENNVNKISVKFVVNSCGIFDSHRDVHVKGCWNKTAKDNKKFLHLREHKATFDNIISDNVKLSVEEIEIKGIKTKLKSVDYISVRDKKSKSNLDGLDVKTTRLASGVPIGADMEYVDSLTLERALCDRKEIE